VDFFVWFEMKKPVLKGFHGFSKIQLLNGEDEIRLKFLFFQR
jgi:hypothetical protein